MKRILENKNDVFLCKVKSFIDAVEENEKFDEYAERYDETEIQNDIPSEPEVEDYYCNLDSEDFLKKRVEVGLILIWI
ncbi:MAG: hypothetical protein E7060_07490 [Treponema bryantii]|nr:hypothetical protein [Treponema bryantii]